jgi:hypothetical protein
MILCLGWHLDGLGVGGVHYIRRDIVKFGTLDFMCRAVAEL